MPFMWGDLPAENNRNLLLYSILNEDETEIEFIQELNFETKEIRKFSAEKVIEMLSSGIPIMFSGPDGNFGWYVSSFDFNPYVKSGFIEITKVAKMTQTTCRLYCCSFDIDGNIIKNEVYKFTITKQ